jgi:hypothetical protein
MTNQSHHNIEAERTGPFLTYLECAFDKLGHLRAPPPVPL